MKKCVRKNVWETNSSSSHSIVITKNDTVIKPEELVYDCNGENHDECIYLYDGIWGLYGDVSDGFGRYPFEILTTFKDKFRYALCEYLGPMYEDDPEWESTIAEFYDIAYELIPGFIDFKFEVREADICVDKNGNEIPHKNLYYNGWDEEKQISTYYYLDKNGNKQPAFLKEDEYFETPDIGMIDHQSMGMLKNFLKDKGISLKEFLSNKKYCIVVDSDETCNWEHYKRSGFINMDFIVEEYS